MEFRVLGPVLALEAGRPVHVPAGRVRSLLAVLLLRANQVVTIDELASQLWDEASVPSNPRAAVQTLVRRLRQALGDHHVQTRPHGYLISIEADQLDLSRFRGLVEQARTAEPTERAGLLEQALRLWQGQPLADLATESGRREVPRLVEERLHVVELLRDARLRLGGHAELTGLTRDHPLRERFWAQLMLAPYRHSEALRHYAQALAIAREIGDRRLQTSIANGLGETHHAMGRPDVATDLLWDALRLAREIGDPDYEARALNGLGHALHDLGDLAAAREHWQDALTLYVKLGIPEADDVRARLTVLDGL